MNDATTGIVITDLSKRYGSVKTYALHKLNVSVAPGEVYGFLGPNGSGKSTTIRLLMNFIQPTSGSATIQGLDVVEQSSAVKRTIGYLSGDYAVYPKMTGRDYLRYMGELQPAVSQTYLNSLAKRLQASLDKRMGDLSRGNRQKIGIIQAFMHQPQILILDEPTSGLDPLMQEVFYDLIADAKGRGASIFVSSHILSEVQKMCDRVGIIREGKLVTERDMSDLMHEAAQTFELTFGGAVPLSKLKAVPGVKVVSHDDHLAILHVHGSLKPLFVELSKHAITKMETRALDLEEVFLRFYQQGAKK
jgi:ABC-2 type transport system ATP-binding protein